MRNASLMIVALAFAATAEPARADEPLTDKESDALVQALLSKEPAASGKAADQVARLQGRARPVIDRLVQRLGSNDDGERNRSAKALGLIGPLARGAGSRLIELGKSRQVDAGVVAEAIANMELDANLAVPFLIHESTSAGNHYEVHDQVTAALASFGPAAVKAVPDLLDLLSSERGQARSNAKYALIAIGPGLNERVPDLARLLEGGNEGTRAAAAEVLGSLGPAAEQAVPDLVKALKAAARRRASLPSAMPSEGLA